MRSEELTRPVPGTAPSSQGSPAERRLRILDPRNHESREAWLSAWSSCADGDVFSHPAYLSERAGADDTPLAAEFDDGRGSKVVYAFLLRRIASDALGRRPGEECFDITTPLLYGGPVCSLGEGADEAETMATFWEEFRHWARAHRIVSEFHRQNPVRSAVPGYPGRFVEQAGHVVKGLEGRSDEQLFTDTSKGFRRNVRRAESAGMEVVVDETGARLDDFLALYYATMDRNHASARFYYPRDFFDMLNTSFTGQVVYLYAVDEGRPVSAELLVHCGDIGYSLLGATAEEALRTGANSFLSFRAFLHARSRGIKDYVLTGGVTNTDDDSLLRFKLSMAKSGLRKYVTAEQIIDEARYARLSSGHPRGSRFFPRYRDHVHREDVGTGAER